MMSSVKKYFFRTLNLWYSKMKNWPDERLTTKYKPGSERIYF